MPKWEEISNSYITFDNFFDCDLKSSLIFSNLYLPYLITGTKLKSNFVTVTNLERRTTGALNLGGARARAGRRRGP